jgi:hypothetical protein
MDVRDQRDTMQVAHTPLRFTRWTDKAITQCNSGRAYDRDPSA